MPTASRPKNKSRKRTINMALMSEPAHSVVCRRCDGQSAALLMRGNMTDGHRVRIESEEIAIEPDQIAPAHQQGAGRDCRRVEPHRKLQVGGAAFIQLPRSHNDAPSIPGKACAERDRCQAV